MPPKRRKTKAPPIHIYNIDPYDGEPRPAHRKMFYMTKWHHKVQPRTLPEFLHDFQVVHFLGDGGDDKVATLDLAGSVHELYHSHLDSHSDRKSMAACLRIGETIAVLKEDYPRAVSAITFVQRESSVLVLFLTTMMEYQAQGMAWFLFSIMHAIVSSRTKDDNIDAYLKANEEENPSAWLYYEKRGFLLLEEPGDRNFPQIFKTVEGLMDIDEDYLAFSHDLKWLTARLTRQHHFLRNPHAPKVLQRFFNNPTYQGIDCPSVYASFPGNLTYGGVRNCMPNYNVYATKFWNEEAFLPKDDHDKWEMYCGPTARITWISRCLTNLDDGVPQDFLEMSLCWFQQHRNAKIWGDVTIVPTNIMSEVSTMMMLYTAYIEARLSDESQAYSSTINSLKEDPKKQKKQRLSHIFHHRIDVHRFMESSTPVIEYILQNKEILKKQYIIMASQDFNDGSWSVTIAMNSGNIGTSQASSICGYFVFDPFRRRPQNNASLQCLFFLKFARWILSDQKDLPTRVPKYSFWTEHVAAPWFMGMYDFYFKFIRLKFNFGYVISDTSQETSDQVYGRFKLFTLHQDYILFPHTTLSEKELKKESGIRSLAFIHDFCSSSRNVADIGLLVNDKGNICGMGTLIPHSPRELRAYLRDVYASIVQLFDRLASSQLGDCRKKTDEYKIYLARDKDDLKVLCVGGLHEMPNADKPYLDLAAYKRWKPLSNALVLERTGKERVDDKHESEKFHDSIRQSSLEVGNSEVNVEEGQVANIISSEIRIADIASMFRNDFRTVESESMKKYLNFQLFMHLHQECPVPIFESTITSIQQHLNELASETETTIETVLETDVLCGTRQRKCIPYMERTSQFRKEYISAVSVFEKQEVIKNIYVTLKGEKYRFLESVEEGQWKELSFKSGLTYVANRMKRLCGEKVLEKKVKKSPQEPEELPVGPGPFVAVNADPDSAPAKNDSLKHFILRNKCPERNGHPPNLQFQKVIREKHLAIVGGFANASEEQKQQFALEVMDELKSKHFIFVEKDEDKTWQTMADDKVRTWVRSSLRKCNNGKEYRVRTPGKTSRKRQLVDTMPESDIVNDDS